MVLGVAITSPSCDIPEGGPKMTSAMQLLGGCRLSSISCVSHARRSGNHALATLPLWLNGCPHRISSNCL